MRSEAGRERIAACGDIVLATVANLIREMCTDLIQIDMQTCIDMHEGAVLPAGTAQHSEAHASGCGVCAWPQTPKAQKREPKGARAERRVGTLQDSSLIDAHDASKVLGGHNSFNRASLCDVSFVGRA